MDIETLIKKPYSNVFRRMLIKRRLTTTGLFESGYVDVSKDVKSYGKISSSIDSIRRNKFTFGNARIVMQNDEGRYNPHNNSSSLWYGYLNQQRTLVKIQAGFLWQTTSSSGKKITMEFPYSPQWDTALWDVDNSLWDGSASTVFNGIISGDIGVSDDNQVTFNIKPLTSIFQDFPARNLTGWTSTGMTASQFITMLRDQTDGSGNFLFRPFFGDTTSNWDISTTSNVFGNLNTSGAESVFDSTVWDIVEKLAEAENFVPYVSREGVFKFVSRSSVDAVSVYDFHGAGSFDSFYGNTIKKINSYGFKVSKYYSKVSVKYVNTDTTTSYEIVESTMTVAAASNPWVLGAKTLSLENFFIPNASLAASLAGQLYTDVSALKNEIDFEATFVPHLDIFNRFTVSYDIGSFSEFNLWDQNDWAADATSTSADLIWDLDTGDAITLDGAEFKFISQEIDLDNFQTKIVAREL